MRHIECNILKLHNGRTADITMAERHARGINANSGVRNCNDSNTTIPVNKP